MKHNKFLSLLLVLAIAFVGLIPTVAQIDDEALVAHMDNYLVNDLPQGWGIVRAADLFTEMLESPDMVLVDVREDAEWAEGHILGAIHIPLRTIADNLDALPDLDANIVVYCKGGHRGAIAMVTLQSLGYTNVRNLAGGVTAWTGEEYELVTDEVEMMRAEAPDGLDADLVSRMNTYLVDELPQGFGAASAEAIFTDLLENPDIVLVDVREPAELEELGYIEGAINVPVRTLAASLDMLPEDKATPIVIYCKAGTRGAIGMAALQILGYTNVRNMNGGIGAWMSVGYDVVGGMESTAAAEGDLDLVSYLDNYMMNVLPQGWGVVKPDAVFAELLEEPPFLLDVREPAELEGNGYIEGAINIPLRDVAANLDKLPALDDRIIVYCKGGHRGMIATVSLQVLGYTNVVNMAGGFDGWLGQDYPAMTDPIGEPEVLGAPEIDPALVETVDGYMQSIPEGFGVVRSDGLFTDWVENPDLFLLDVREVSEWENDGYIEGAVNVPLREIVANLDVLPEDKETRIVVYCKAGTRGAIGMTILQMLGYTNVQNLAGGFSGWISAGYPGVNVPAAEDPVEVEIVLPEADPLSAEELQPIASDWLANIPQGFSSIAVETAHENIDSYFVLDVRELDEYEAGHIEGAVLVPVREVLQNLHLLPDTSTPILVYCAAGTRGAFANTALEMLGYDAINMRGGFRAWTDAGYESVLESTPEVSYGPFPEVDAALWTTLNNYLSNLPAGFSVVRVPDFNTELLEGNELTIVDVRTAAEFEAGTIEGAINIPLRTLGENLDMLPVDASIVLVGSSTQRSAQALFVLQALGYEDARALGGGTGAWTGAGFDLVTE